MDKQTIISTQQNTTAIDIGNNSAEPQDIMLSKRSQSQKVTYDMIPFIRHKTIVAKTGVKSKMRV